MRKNYGLRIDAKKLLTLSIAATMVVSALSFIAPSPKAYADFAQTYSAGSGSGTIFLTLHRLPESYWPWCFAKDCQQIDPATGQIVNVTTGTGTWMNFIVYNSAGQIIIGANGQAFANENGVFITGLAVGQTYRISPLYYNTTGGPEQVAHKVIFNNWADCNSPYAFTDVRPFTITSNTIISAAGYYRYVPDGQDPNVPVTPCYAGVPVPIPKLAGGSTPQAPLVPHKVNVDMADVYTALNFKQLVIKTILRPPAGVTEVASVDTSNITKISEKMIPDVSLSGIPLGPNGVVFNYKSLYDIQNYDSDGVVNAMNTAPLLGIDWYKLSDMQKCYLTLSLQYNMPTASTIPSTNLSGVPLGPQGLKVTYHSLYDIQNDDSIGLIKAMIATQNLGIDWGTLSDSQKEYLALVLDYGLPSKQV